MAFVEKDREWVNIDEEEVFKTNSLYKRYETAKPDSYLLVYKTEDSSLSTNQYSVYEIDTKKLAENGILIKSAYSQKWPYNSYISFFDETKKEEFANAVNLAVDFSPLLPATAFAEGKTLKGIASVVDPFTTSIVQGTFDTVKHLWRWAKKIVTGSNSSNANNDPDYYNGLPPAGCGPIVIAQLMWHWREYPSVQEYYPKINKLADNYYYNGEKTYYWYNGEFDDIKSTMKTIWDTNFFNFSKISIDKEYIAIANQLNFNGTFADIKTNSLEGPLHQFKSKITNPSIEMAAKSLYEAIVLNKIPVVACLSKKTKIGNIPSHYVLFDYCYVDRTKLVDTGKFSKSCKFGANFGWGEIGEHNSSLLEDYLDEHNYCSIYELLFFAPEKIQYNVPSNKYFIDKLEYIPVSFNASICGNSNIKTTVYFKKLAIGEIGHYKIREQDGTLIYAPVEYQCQNDYLKIIGFTKDNLPILKPLKSTISDNPLGVIIASASGGTSNGKTIFYYNADLYWYCGELDQDVVNVAISAGCTTQAKINAAIKSYNGQNPLTYKDGFSLFDRKAHFKSGEIVFVRDGNGINNIKYATINSTINTNGSSLSYIVNVMGNIKTYSEKNLFHKYDVALK